jgi:hypothetical protein
MNGVKRLAREEYVTQKDAQCDGWRHSASSIRGDELAQKRLEPDVFDEVIDDGERAHDLRYKLALSGIEVHAGQVS